MLTKIVDSTLLLIAFAGFAMTLLIFNERAELIEEYESYVNKVGRLEVEEAEKIYVKRMVTDIPDHFAWRVYLPPTPRKGLKLQIFAGDDRNGASHYYAPDNEGQESTIRVTLRHADDGVKASINGVMGEIKDAGVAKFVHQHWSELQFDIATIEETVVQNDDEVIKLLVVKMPKRLVDEFVSVHGEEFRAAIERPLSFYHGFKDAKDWP